MFEIITQHDLDKLRLMTKTGKPHPVLALLHDQVMVNTESSAQHIAQTQEGKQWLASLKPRLLDTTDFTNASSALGEIRAHGALLETGLSVSPRPSVPGKEVEPEFEVSAETCPVIVEVHSRQLDEKQSISIVSQLQSAQTSSRAGALTITEIPIMPFGVPNPDKPDDSVLTNAISRIARIKQEDKQIDKTKPFVLWLDFQDPTVWGGMSIAEEQLAPIYTESKDGIVGSGALWFALYGHKSDPMIESQGLDYHSIPMLHDGRFAQSRNISAVVYSLPRATILMEHPSPLHPLPSKFRVSLLRAPWFSLDRSVIEWQPGMVSARIDLDRQTIKVAAKVLKDQNFS